MQNFPSEKPNPHEELKTWYTRNSFCQKINSLKQKHYITISSSAPMKTFKFFMVFLQWKSFPDTVNNTRGHQYSDILTQNAICPTNKLLVDNISVTPKKQIYISLHIITYLLPLLDQLSKIPCICHIYWMKLSASLSISRSLCT